MRRLVGALAGVAAVCLPVSSATATETVSYTYDSLGRLVTVESSGTVNNNQTTTIGYDAAGNRTGYTASDGPPPASLSIGNASVTEGGTLSFTVTRSGNTAIAASASYATSNGTAVAPGDYTSKSGTVSFSSGQTSKAVTVSTIDDSVVESAETMTVTLSNPSSGAAIIAAVGTGTINDNDTGPAFSIANATASEGDNLVFTITVGAHSGTVSVTATTSPGTALAGSDYTHKSQTISFTSSQTSKTFSVATIEDTVPEATETMTVTLSNPSSGTTIANGTATGIIEDDDTSWSSAITSGVTTGCSGYCAYIGYISGVIGSMNNTSYNGYNINELYTMTVAGGYVLTYLTMSGSSAPPNSGWTSITIPGVGTLGRAGAAYTASGNTATWVWQNTAVLNSGTVTIQ